MHWSGVYGISQRAEWIQRVGLRSGGGGILGDVFWGVDLGNDGVCDLRDSADDVADAAEGE